MSSQTTKWKQILSTFSSHEFDHRDADTVLTALSSSGLLDSTLHEKMDETDWSALNQPLDEFRLFLAGQIASQCLVKNVKALNNRQQDLIQALSSCEASIKRVHDEYDEIRTKRTKLRGEILKVEMEIQECDRLLKSPAPSSTASRSLPMVAAEKRRGVMQKKIKPLLLANVERHGTPAAATSEDREDDESSWDEQGFVQPSSYEHMRGSLMFGGSPTAKNGSNALTFHASDAGSSPKFSRSRASSGTSGGVDDDDLVLFGTFNNSSWFAERKEAFEIKQKLADITEGQVEDDEEEEQTNEEGDEYRV